MNKLGLIDALRHECQISKKEAAIFQMRERIERAGGLSMRIYASLVEHLSKHDLGRTFNSEWAKRVKKLIQYSVNHDKYIPMLLRKYS